MCEKNYDKDGEREFDVEDYEKDLSCSAPAAGSAEIKCKACGWLGLCDDVLTSDHPFQKGCHVYGCPQCGEIEGFEQSNALREPERD